MCWWLEPYATPQGQAGLPWAPSSLTALGLQPSSCRDRDTEPASWPYRDPRCFAYCCCNPLLLSAWVPATDSSTIQECSRVNFLPMLWWRDHT